MYQIAPIQQYKKKIKTNEYLRKNAIANSSYPVKFQIVC